MEERAGVPQPYTKGQYNLPTANTAVRLTLTPPVPSNQTNHKQLFRLSSQRLQIDVSQVDIHAYFTTLCDLVQVRF